MRKTKMNTLETILTTKGMAGKHNTTHDTKALNVSESMGFLRSLWNLNRRERLAGRGRAFRRKEMWWRWKVEENVGDLVQVV